MKPPRPPKMDKTTVAYRYLRKTSGPRGVYRGCNYRRGGLDAGEREATARMAHWDTLGVLIPAYLCCHPLREADGDSVASPLDIAFCHPHPRALGPRRRRKRDHASGKPSGTSWEVPIRPPPRG